MFPSGTPHLILEATIGNYFNVNDLCSYVLLEHSRKKGLKNKKITIIIIIIKTHILIIYGLIIDPHNDQLPVGLIAQLVPHCTRISEVRVRLPFRGPFLESPENFSGPKSHSKNYDLLIL